MEPTEINEQQQPAAEPQLLLLEDAQAYLHETGKWAKFLAIMGYIFTAFILIAGIGVSFLGSLFNNGLSGSPMKSFGPFMGIFYILMGVVYFFFSYYLYQFGSSVKNGVEYNDSIQISKGLSRLKSLFKFWGILTIIFIALYVLIIIGVIIGVGVGASMMR